VKPAERKPRKAKVEDKPVEAREERNEAPVQEANGRSQNNRNRGGRGGRRRDDNVVGMGDHMPSFIALSFDERRAS
jgi:ATP-dependent RNA helicase RhlE